MINSVLKVLDILDLFSASQPRLSLAQISERMGIPKSTAHNLLTTLLSRGFVEKVDNDYYALGTAVIRLTQMARVNVELRDRAAPLLREMSDTCRESVYLTVREGDNILYIYAVESPRRLLARTAVGDMVPLHCTAAGKAILAHLPDQEIAAYVRRTGLPVFTQATLRDLATLRTEMETTRSRGYSLDRQEHEQGTFCVGAPIFDGIRRLVASCSISSTDPEIVGERLAQLSTLVKYTAQEVSRHMGYVPASPSHVVLFTPQDAG
jgi:DNA-binding IclR family transcriptional regulator